MSMATLFRGISLFITLLLLMGCIQPENGGENGTDPVPTGKEPEWTLQPQTKSEEKGQFTLQEGSATESSVLRYYYALSDSTPPEKNLHSSWEGANWRQVENPQEPVRYLSTGDYTIYGVAVSGNYRIRSNSSTVAVEGATPPLVWVDNPQIDITTATGTVNITVSGKAANAVDEQGAVTLEADPVPEYRFYYARYTNDEVTGAEIAPIIPTGNLGEDWQNSGWTEISISSAETLLYGKYEFYGIASNNGGHLRYEFEPVVLGGAPQWPVAPEVQPGEEGSFKMTSGGTPGGYPAANPDDTVYYYGDGTLTPPVEDDQNEPNKWASAGWKIVMENVPETDIVPAARDYQLYGVATNTLGTGIKKVEFTVNGLSEFKSVGGHYFRTDLMHPPSSDHIPFTFYDDEIIVEWGTGAIFNDAFVYGSLFFKNDSYKFVGDLYQKGVGWKSKGNPPGDWSSRDQSYTSLSYTGAVAVYFDKRLYLLGGIDNKQHVNSVSYLTKFTERIAASQGDTWVIHAYLSGNSGPISDSPGWFHGRWEARAHASAVVHDGAIYLFAGEDANGNTFNDIWKSEAGGRNWKKIADAAPWPSRSHAAAVSFNGRLWIAGGKDGSTHLGDVWSSLDGENWIPEPKVGEIWQARSQHAMFVFQDRLWVVGGQRNGFFLKDIWYSFNGREWTRFGEYSGEYVKPVVHPLGHHILIKDVSTFSTLEAEWISE